MLNYFLSIEYCDQVVLHSELHLNYLTGRNFCRKKFLWMKVPKIVNFAELIFVDD